VCLVHTIVPGALGLPAVIGAAGFGGGGIGAGGLVDEEARTSCNVKNSALPTSGSAAISYTVQGVPKQPKNY
jgi:hypothetical protein